MKLLWITLAVAIVVTASAFLYSRRVALPPLTVPIATSSPAPVWRVFEGGVFAPRNGDVPILDELPATCQPCDYVHLRYESPSLYECASTVSQKECDEAREKRIAAMRGSLKSD